MAYVSSHSAAPSVSDRLSAVLGAIKAKLARRAIYAQTLKELGALSDRELLDLGISPQSIHSVAYEAAYGR